MEVAYRAVVIAITVPQETPVTIAIKASSTQMQLQDANLWCKT